MKKKQFLNLLIHIGGSIVFMLLPIMFSPDRLNLFLFKIPPFQQEFFTFFLLLISFYFIYYFAIPKLLFEKKNVVFVGVVLLNLIVLFTVKELFFSAFFDESPQPNRPIRFHFRPPFPFNNHISDFFKLAFNFSIVVISSLLIRIYTRSKTIEKEKTELELKYLKAHLNPHFLFNTLNGIYALSIEENATKTSSSILQLSEILRFTLTESQHDFISVQNEKNYIESYINLQKIRCDEVTKIVFSFDFENKNTLISPLILVPYLENAFKYGVNPDYNSLIEIKIDVDQENVLTASIYNSKIPNKIFEKFGLGLISAKKKLDHYYSSKYTLEIQDEIDFFCVKLKVQL